MQSEDRVVGLWQAVIKACVDNSTHYIDVTGEIPWMPLAMHQAFAHQLNWYHRKSGFAQTMCFEAVQARNDCQVPRYSQRERINDCPVCWERQRLG